MTTDLSGDEGEKDLVDMIKERYDAGMGRNAIARDLDVTTWRVSNICKLYGWQFDQDRTRNAVSIAVASAGEARRDLARRFRGVADTALKQVELTGADDGQPLFDADDTFRWLKVAGTAVDKDLAIQQQLDSVDDDTAMRQAGDALNAFGDMIRGLATQREIGPGEPDDRDDAGAPPIYQPEDDEPP